MPTPTLRTPNRVMILRHGRVGLSSRPRPAAPCHVSWYYHRVIGSGSEFVSWDAIRGWMGQHFNSYTRDQITRARDYFNPTVGP